MNFKNIHIGQLIKDRVQECEIPISRICNFLKCEEDEIVSMYENPSIDTILLLRWSKLLEYDFFRLYSQHIILFAPKGNNIYNQLTENKKNQFPRFRKNIYTREMIEPDVADLQSVAVSNINSRKY